MPKVLKLNNSGIWVYLGEDGDFPENHSEPTLRTRHTKESKLELFLETLKHEIEKSGHKTLKVSTLKDRFSIRKRSAKNLVSVKGKMVLIQVS